MSPARDRTGKRWNDTPISGNRIISSGILNCELYIGVIRWNRQRRMKNPDTGRRVMRLNPESEWIHSDDATVVAPPKQRNTRGEKADIKAGKIPDVWKDKPAKLRQKDRDAHWTVRFSKAKVDDEGKEHKRDIAVPIFGYPLRGEGYEPVAFESLGELADWRSRGGLTPDLLLIDMHDGAEHDAFPWTSHRICGLAIYSQGMHRFRKRGRRQMAVIW